MLKLLLILSILTTHPNTQDANIGVLICDYHSGDTIDAYRPNAVIPPASTMKVLTAATALELWGADYRIQTPITYDGYIQDGTLHGNLYIEGRGDPTFGSRYVGDKNFMYKWVRRLREAGIQRITGSIVADLSYFDADALNPFWLWEDAGNYYAPGIFALAYQDNTLNIVLRSGAVGSIAEVLYTTPEIPELEFENHIRCTHITYDGAFVHGVPYNNTRYAQPRTTARKRLYQDTAQQRHTGGLHGAIHQRETDERTCTHPAIQPRERTAVRDHSPHRAGVRQPIRRDALPHLRC